MRVNEQYYAYALKKTVIIAFLNIAAYALLYRILVYINPQAFFGIYQGDTIIDFLYFSVITFTTTGHGDIYPLTSLGRFLVSTEIIAGILLMGLILYYNTKRIIVKRKNG